MPGFFTLDRPAIVATIKAAGHHGIHNFTVGTLTTYFRLETVEALFNKGALILDGLPGSARRKVFIYNEDQLSDDYLLSLQKTSTIYSIHPLNLTKGSKFKETAYSLAAVFNPESYPNARKRSKRLLQPFQRIVKAGIDLRALTLRDLPQIKALHTLWCDWKLSQPKTYQMMFPKQRYLSCAEIAISRPDEYFALGAFDANGLHAVHIYYIEGGSAFDLANFAASWRMYSNFSEDFYIASLAALQDQGLTYINAGASLNKYLSAFKSHWPNFTVDSWMYSRIS